MSEAKTDTPIEAPKPLTLMEKAKTGGKGFLKTALDALPRTLMFSGIAFVGSAVLGATTGWDPLHITDSTTTSLIGRLLSSMALGGAISGAVGAYECVKCANQQRSAEIAAQQQSRAVPTRSNAPEMLQAPTTPQRDLPMGKPQLPGKTGASLF